MFLLKNKIKAGVLPKSQKVVLGKIQDSRFKIQDSRQAGITLLLAILLLSSILAITFSLAAVMFIEVRDSGDLLKTEPAFYAATGIGEQAFFNLERGVCTATGGNCSYTINFANNVLMPTAPTILSTSMPIFIDKVKTGSIFPNSLNNYYFCTTAASGSSSSGCGYGKVTVNYITTNNSGGPLYAYLCEFDPTGQTSYLTAPCTQVNDLTHGVNQSYWKQADNGFYQNSDGSVTLTPTNPFVSWTITNSNLQQQLILTNPGSYGDVYAKIQTFGSDGITGKGLPYVGKTAVDINTINASVGRKIQVVVPNASSGSVSGGAVCPVGSVSLSANPISVGGTSAASAPAGFSGGSFSSDMTSVATVSGSTVTGAGGGTANISGSGWNNTNGATGCPLIATNLTVNSAGYNGFAHYRAMTIQASQISNSVPANFPVLVSYANATLASPGGNVKNTTTVNGQTVPADLIFTSDSGCSSPLNWEVEKYNSVTGELEAWVKMPFALSNSSNSYFYMCYGKYSINTFQGSNTLGSNTGSAWDSNYKGVWHMNDSAANTTVKDSTSNGFNGTNAANTNTKSIAGKIGNSLSYNGSGDQTTIATSGSLSGSFTVEQWVYGGGTFIGSRSPNDTSFDAKLQGGNTIHGDIGSGSGWINTSADASFTYTTSAWYDIVYTVSPTGYTIYANGAPVGSNTFSGTPLLYDANHILTIGNCGNSCGEYFGGNIDEVRVSNIVRSADWIKTEYNNQLNPSAFVVVGTEQ